MALHAITALFHNRLVSQRAQACHHASRQTVRLRLQHLPLAGMEVHAEHHILSAEECVCVFICAWATGSYT